MKTIYFAAGCFWGAEHFFSGVDGVSAVTTGFANGDTPDPTYKEVYTDTTGYAETVRIDYNPSLVDLRTLTELLFTIIDPLSVNRQGEDEGSRYRTGVYYTDEAEFPVVKAVFDEVALRLGRPLAVELEPLRCFFPAEEYHQHYLDKNPGGYCHIPLKTFRYLRLYQDLRNLLAGEDDIIARMANTAALIHERMHFWWTGFYIVRGEELVLGPFQGPVACYRIRRGRGVCGTAWAEKRCVVVPDVEEFPGHIACSAASKSEIVVPLRSAGGEVTSVLDIDSAELATFDDTDALWLGKITELL